MRLPPIDPADMTPEQRGLYDDMRAGIAASYAGVQTEDGRGALVGPFNPWLHAEDIGKAIWALNRVLAAPSSLPDQSREVATLVVGAHFRAAYEVGSHRILARGSGLTGETIKAIIAGRRPIELTEVERCAHDMASVLCGGGVVPVSLYALALRLFGARGTSELVHLCGFYALTCMTLNAFDVPGPEAS